MGAIYQMADAVWTWLGVLDETLNRTMLFLSMIAAVYDELVLEAEVLKTSSAMVNSYRPDEDKADLWQTPTISAWEVECWLDITSTEVKTRNVIATQMRKSRSALHLNIAGRSSKFYQQLYSSGQTDTLCIHNLILELSSRQYRRRGWIIQEVALSGLCSLYARSTSIPFWVFQGLVLNRFQEVNPEYNCPHSKYKYSEDAFTWAASVAVWPVCMKIELGDNHPSCYSASNKISGIRRTLNRHEWPDHVTQSLLESTALGLTTLKWNMSQGDQIWNDLLYVLRKFSGSQCAGLRDGI